MLFCKIVTLKISQHSHKNTHERVFVSTEHLQIAVFAVALFHDINSGIISLNDPEMVHYHGKT